MSQRHAICRRADGSVDELTFDVVDAVDAVTGQRGTQATNFRTIDGKPLVLHPDDAIEITYATD